MGCCQKITMENNLETWQQKLLPLVEKDKLVKVLRIVLEEMSLQKRIISGLNDTIQTLKEQLEEQLKELNKIKSIKNHGNQYKS